MKTIFSASSPAHRQSGVGSLAIVILLMLILVAAVTTVLKTSGSSVADAAKNEEQVAALFIAESGVERAKAEIKSANDDGSYTNTTCTTLDQSAQTLGRGTFKVDVTPTCTCSGGICTGTACDECNVVVKGTINNSNRYIRTQISTVSTDGKQGCSPTPVLGLTTTNSDDSAVFTNLAYRAKGNSTCGGTGGSNAHVGQCTITGSGNTCNPTVYGWDLDTGGTNNVSSMGVASAVTAGAGSYDISQALWDNSSTLVPSTWVSRSWVQTGVLFKPPSVPPGAVGLTGSYGCTTSCPGGAKTTGTSSVPNGAVPRGWNCALTNGSAAASQAATANTLTFGFSSETAGNLLDHVLLGSQPLRRQLSMSGATEGGKSLYSQIWYSYNAAYISDTGAVNDGADFTGAVGAIITATGGGSPLGAAVGGIVRGNTTNGSTDLYVNSVSGGGGARYGALRVGDSISGPDIQVGTTIEAFGTTAPVGAGGTGHYTLSHPMTGTSGGVILTVRSKILRITGGINAGGVVTAGDTLPSGTIQAFTTPGTTGSGGVGEYVLNAQVAPFDVASINISSNLLRVSAVSGGGFVAGDTVTSGLVTTPTILAFTTSGTTGSWGIGDYVLSAQVAPIGTTATMQTTDLNVTTTTPATIRVPSNGGGIPAEGTGLASTTGNTQFDAVQFTGTISGFTMTVSGTTGTLHVGDALFGRNVKPDTRITVIAPGGGNGAYTVNNSQTSTSDFIYARVAPLSGATDLKFTISKPLTTRLSGTQLCGGVCMMLSHTANTTFTLSGFPSGDDWGSGFACLSGVDPTTIKTLGVATTRRTNWSEPVQ